MVNAPVEKRPAADGHPRVFISYRHAEKTGGPEAEVYNLQHRNWVERFARDLATYRVEPVLDLRLRQIVGRFFDSDPTTEPAIANIALAAIPICHAFLPILTPGYAERVGFGGFESQTRWQDGYVFDEWQSAMALSLAGKIQMLPIWRNVLAEKILDFPSVLHAGVIFDFTDETAYEENLETLPTMLHFERTVQTPSIDRSLMDQIVWFLKQAGCLPPI
jgi:hypothetical protein